MTATLTAPLTFTPGLRVVVVAPTARNRHHAGRRGRVIRVNPDGRAGWVRLDRDVRRRQRGAEVDAILAPSECRAEEVHS